MLSNQIRNWIMAMFVKGHMIVWASRLVIPDGISTNETKGGKLRKHRPLSAAQSIRRNMRPEMMTAIFRDAAENGIQNTHFQKESKMKSRTMARSPQDVH